MSEYFKIGKIVAAHGLKGELVLKHVLGKKTSLKGLQTVFIEDKKKSFLPWFIQSATIKNEVEVFLTLEGVEVREAAIKFIQKELWVPETDFKKFLAKSSPINLLGFHIIDKNKDLGPILELMEQPHQLLARLDIKGKEVLVPLAENFINKIDKKNSQILVTLPDGFLEIYLGNG